MRKILRKCVKYFFIININGLNTKKKINNNLLKHGLIFFKLKKFLVALKSKLC